jgi:hypothetical protein
MPGRGVTESKLVTDMNGTNTYLNICEPRRHNGKAALLKPGSVHDQLADAYMMPAKLD